MIDPDLITGRINIQPAKNHGPEDTYALVKDGVVVNVIVWDGKSPFNPPDGHLLVQSFTNANIGDLFDGQIFTKPLPTEAVEALGRNPNLSPPNP